MTEQQIYLILVNGLSITGTSQGLTTIQYQVGVLGQKIKLILLRKVLYTRHVQVSHAEFTQVLIFGRMTIITTWEVLTQSLLLLSTFIISFSCTHLQP